MSPDRSLDLSLGDSSPRAETNGGENKERFMDRARSSQRWLIASAFSVALSLALAIGGPTFLAPNSTGVASAQSDNEGDENDNAAAPAPTAVPKPQMQPAVAPSPGPGGSPGAGTSTSTTSAPSTGSGSQQSTTTTDPDRGGIEMPGQPACYKPAENVTERRMYNEHRPACAGKQQ
jgi:hypothetical protein